MEKKEKKPMSQKKLDFLELVDERQIFANWCKTEVWIDEGHLLKWSDFYDLIKEKIIAISKVETKWVTSYFVTELGKETLSTNFKTQ